jgi:hypothetical protein
MTLLLVGYRKRKDYARKEGDKDICSDREWMNRDQGTVLKRRRGR